MIRWGGPGAFVVKNSDTTSWHQLFSLIALVQPKLLSVLYINKMIRNAPEHYETHQNLSLGSNGVDQVRSLQKCPMRLRGPNFCVNCNSSAGFAPCFVQLWNDHKCTQTLRNAKKNLSLGSHGLDRVCPFRKIPSQLHGSNFCTNCTSLDQFAQSFVR